MKFIARIMAWKHLLEALLEREKEHIDIIAAYLADSCQEWQERALANIFLTRETVMWLLDKIPGEQAKILQEKIRFLDGVYCQSIIEVYRSQGRTNAAFDALSRYASIVYCMHSAVNENARELPTPVRMFTSDSHPRKIDKNQIFYDDIMAKIADILIDIDAMQVQLTDKIKERGNRSKFVVDFFYTKARLEEIYKSMHMHWCFEEGYKYADMHTCIGELREEYNYIGDIIHGIMYNGSSATAEPMVKKLLFLSSSILLCIVDG
jgi:hypothetical protein